MFEEHELHFALISESWLKDGSVLDRDIIDLEHGSGLQIIYRNRPRRATSARAVGGGVSIIYNKSRCNFRERRLAGNKFELVAAVGKVVGLARQVIVLSIYIEPKMKVADLKELIEAISDFIQQVKSNCTGEGPLIFVGGDMNKRDIKDAFEAFNDIVQINFEPTRGMACLDIMFSNGQFSEVATAPPLVNELGVESDHRCVIFRAREETRDFTWVNKRVRKHTEEACLKFGARLMHTEWDKVLGLGNTDDLVHRFESYTCGLVDELFPVITCRRRSNEKPWITRGMRRLARRKRREYRLNGKSQRWFRLQERMDELMADSKLMYVERVKAGGQRAYFNAIKQLNCKEKPREWEVSSLFPEASEVEVGNKVAEFFTQITDNFTPLGEPVRGQGRGPVTEEYVAKKLREAKKPNSTVKGDILPRLMKRFHPLLVKPVTKIFNVAFESSSWPSNWKSETAVIIPKNSNPSSLSECRNISCTNFLSKVMESIILDDLRREIRPDPIQYGGTKGVSVNHLLVDAWHKILGGLDRGEHAVLLGIDYEKAFNRLDHAECLKQLRELGASESSISMVRAFLTGRTVRVRLPCGTLSDPYKLNGGSPQGSILGCLLYCLTTQQINGALRRNGANASGRTNDSEPVANSGEVVHMPHGDTVTSREEGMGLLEEEVASDRSSNESSDSFLTANGSTEGSTLGDLDHVGAVMVVKYIDDTSVIENIDPDTTTKHFTTAKTIETVLPPGSTELLLQIDERSREIGMRVNGKKTQLLCISSDNGCITRACIDLRGTKIESQDKLKLLGFVFSSSPDMSGQFEEIRRKFRSRFWSLIHLKRAGLSHDSLFQMYTVFIRPVIENNSVIYHHMLTKHQSNEIEKMQKRVVRLCYGVESRYAEICATKTINPLYQRRQEATRKFVSKALKNPRFSDTWFARRDLIDNNLRRRRPIIEEKARTTRFYNSPLLSMQRIANDILTN